MSTTRETIEAYWATLEARDWPAFAAVLADDVVYETPQTRERIRGRDAYVRFNVEYPGDWHLTPRRILVDGDEAACWVDVRVGDEPMFAIAFIRVAADGRVREVIDVWPEAYEPPAGREHLVERY